LYYFNIHVEQNLFDGTKSAKLPQQPLKHNYANAHQGRMSTNPLSFQIPREMSHAMRHCGCATRPLLVCASTMMMVDR